MTRERCCHSGERFSPFCHSEELRSEESLGRCCRREKRFFAALRMTMGVETQNDNRGGQNDGGREKRFFAALRMTGRLRMTKEGDRMTGDGRKDSSLRSE